MAMAVLALPLACVAQKFQEPTKEELQMTSDPKAPGAPAVFLYREEKTDNAGHYVSSYARIKVLSDRGKEWATVEVPYDPQMASPPVIEGRTIHSDGTVIPLAGKAADLLTIRSYKDHLKAAMFTLPSVEAGSILEYRWTVPVTKGTLSFTVSDSATPLYSSLMAKQTPTWEVQQEIYVHKSRYYFNPFTLLESGDRTVLNNTTAFTSLVNGERANNLLFTQHLPAGIQVNRSPKGEYFLELSDVPAIPSEAETPPRESTAYRVVFYYSPYPNADVYWESEIKRVSKKMNHDAEQTSAIMDAARQITVGADTPEAKARKLYDAVQALENTSFTPAGAQLKQPFMAKELKRAQDVWNDKKGTGNETAALYLALARAAGLEADGLLVADRSLHIFDPNYLSLDQLDALLAVLHVNGKDIYLDPGDKFCPYGQLDWRHSLAGGVEESVKTPVFTPPNSPNDALTAHSADLTVDATGAVTGTVKILMNGPEALRWRQLNLTAGAAEVRRQFDSSLRAVLPPGIASQVDQLHGLDSTATNLSAVVKVSGQLGSIAGKKILLPGFFFPTAGLAELAAGDSRTLPVDVRFAEQVIDDVNYHLPTGYSVESAPQPVQLPWPRRAALVVKTAPGPGVIDIKHIFARAFVLLDAKEYPALRDFSQKADAIDRQQLVLAPGAGAARN